MTKRMISVKVGTPEMHNIHWRGGERRPRIMNTRSIYPDGTNVDDLIQTLQDIKQEYGQDYTNLSVEGERDCGCYHDCSCSPSYYIWGTRLESDIEYEYRLSEEARLKALQEERDRRAYEELRKKFGE